MKFLFILSFLFLGCSRSAGYEQGRPRMIPIAETHYQTLVRYVDKEMSIVCYGFANRASREGNQLSCVRIKK